MTDSYKDEIDISENDAQDGFMPPSLRTMFIPEEDHQTEQALPPVAVQAFGPLCLVVFIVSLDFIGKGF